MSRDTAASLRVVSDVVPSGLLGGPARDRNAFPASLSKTWGEAAWTAPDLWMSVPILAALRTSAVLSGMTLPADLDVQRTRTYKRLRQSVEDLRARAEAAGQEAPVQEEVQEPPTPTDAMVALGGQVTKWTARLVVLAFVGIVIGLGFEFGLVQEIPIP